MKRFSRVFATLAFIAVFAACKKDDDSVTITPPRDYTLQYTVEKVQIEEYLKTHYIAEVDADYNVTILPTEDEAISIWNDPRTSEKPVTLNGVAYTLYYVTLNEGVGDMPTKYDNALVAYQGNLLDGTEFTNEPFPQSQLPLSGTIEGWQEIIPLFKSGTYVDIPNDPNPATYENYGAGIMFLPSDFGYYNITQANIPAYSPLVFTFKLYDVEYADHDGDGILSKDETAAGADPIDYDSDADGDANFVDTDDDNDGYLTKNEIVDENGEPYEVIPTCDGGTLPKHLDPACH